MKQIIVLERPGPGTYRVVLWAAVPAARQAFYANPGAKSAYNGATGPELAALQNGSVVESVELLQIQGTPTLPAVQATLEARWAAFQAEITSSNPWNRYGTSWDGTTWTAGGVA